MDAEVPERAGSCRVGCVCPPLSAEPLSQAQAEQVAPLLTALAEPVQLRLMSLIASHPGGEACVCDLTWAFDLSQPTISHHLKVLHEAGLLDCDRRGVWVYYRARTEALASLGALIGDQPKVTGPRSGPARPRGTGAHAESLHPGDQQPAGQAAPAHACASWQPLWRYCSPLTHFPRL
jgi:ArsR family transcriptional regulator, arsenate/arsenite/antimonite-responsive transcriptional repressor